MIGRREHRVAPSRFARQHRPGADVPARRGGLLKLRRRLQQRNELAVLQTCRMVCAESSDAASASSRLEGPAVAQRRVVRDSHADPKQAVLRLFQAGLNPAFQRLLGAHNQPGNHSRRVAQALDSPGGRKGEPAARLPGSQNRKADRGQRHLALGWPPATIRTRARRSRSTPPARMPAPRSAAVRSPARTGTRPRDPPVAGTGPSPRVRVSASPCARHCVSISYGSRLLLRSLYARG